MGVQPISVPQSLAYVLNSAGDKSGVDFEYLLQTAIRESSLNPAAKAQTSSATGLFQFLESTWLEVMKSEGPRLGYQNYADAITVDSDGDYVIADKALRAEVLALREDPAIAADLAAAFTRKNGDYLHQRFGRMPSPGELYIAHFLGAKGAEKFFAAGLANPDQVAAQLFPRQAKANRAIFYDAGEPRTIRQVYRALVARHELGAIEVDPRFAAQQLAADPMQVAPVPATRSSSKWPDAVPVPSRFGPADMSFTTLFSTESELGPRPLAIPHATPLAATPAPLAADVAPAPFVLPPNPLLAPLEPAVELIPAPDPVLSAYSGAPPDEAPFAASAPEGEIKPRVLLTERLETPAIQVVTNLYSR